MEDFRRNSMDRIRNSIEYFRQNSRRPERWSIIIITVIGCIVGALAIAGGILFYVHYHITSHKKSSKGNKFKKSTELEIIQPLPNIIPSTKRYDSSSDDGNTVYDYKEYEENRANRYEPKPYIPKPLPDLSVSKQADDSTLKQELTYKDIDYDKLKAEHNDLNAWAIAQIKILINGNDENWASEHDIEIEIKSVTRGSITIKYVLKSKEGKKDYNLDAAARRISEHSELKEFAVRLNDELYAINGKIKEQEKSPVEDAEVEEEESPGEPVDVAADIIPAVVVDAPKNDLEVSKQQTLIYPGFDFVRFQKDAMPSNGLMEWAHDQIKTLLEGKNGEFKVHWKGIQNVIKKVRGSADEVAIEYVLKSTSPDIFDAAIKQISENSKLEEFAVNALGSKFTTVGPREEIADVIPPVDSHVVIDAPKNVLEVSDQQTLTYPEIDDKFWAKLEKVADGDLKHWAHFHIESMIKKEPFAKDIEIDVKDVKRESDNLVIDYILKAKNMGVDLKTALERINDDETNGIVLGDTFTTAGRIPKVSDSSQVHITGLKESDPQILKYPGLDFDRMNNREVASDQLNEWARRIITPLIEGKDGEFKEQWKDIQIDIKDVRGSKDEVVIEYVIKAKSKDIYQSAIDRIKNSAKLKRFAISLRGGQRFTTQGPVPTVPKEDVDSEADKAVTTRTRSVDETFKKSDPLEKPKWRRSEYGPQNVLDARNEIAKGYRPPDYPGDPSFKIYDKSGNWPHGMHFDWWMFPWAAGANARGFEVYKGDVVDLIKMDNFVDQYVESAEYLIKEHKTINSGIISENGLFICVFYERGRVYW